MTFRTVIFRNEVLYCVVVFCSVKPVQIKLSMYVMKVKYMGDSSYDAFSDESRLPWLYEVCVFFTL